MQWIRTILEKHVGEEKLNVEDVLTDINKEFPQHAVPKADFNAKNEEVKRLTTQVSDRDVQIDNLSKVDADALEKTIKDLQADNEAKDKKYKQEVKDLQVKHAAERQINELKAHDLTSVLAHVDLSEADLNDDGTVQGLKDKLEKLKEEKTFLFEIDEPVDPEPKPKPTGAQPGKPKDKEPGGTPDVTKMSYSEFEAYLASQNK